MQRIANILLFVLFVFNTQSFAEKSGKITGRVIDSKGNAPIAGAQIVILNERIRIGAMTLQDGRYSISLLPELYSAKVMMEGFVSQTIDSVFVLEAQETIVDFTLNSDSIPICEVHGVELIPIMRFLKYPLESDLKFLNWQDVKIYMQAQREFFPNAEGNITGLQNLSEEGQMVKLLICPKCREAKDQWLQEHNRIKVLESN